MVYSETSGGFFCLFVCGIVDKNQKVNYPYIFCQGQFSPAEQNKVCLNDL